MAVTTNGGRSVETAVPGTAGGEASVQNTAGRGARAGGRGVGEQAHEFLLREDSGERERERESSRHATRRVSRVSEIGARVECTKGMEGLKNREPNGSQEHEHQCHFGSIDWWASTQ